MRRLLAAAVLMALMPAAHAQDKGKSDFSANGEFRLRDTYEQNEMGNKNTKPASHNGVDQRFKMGLKFKANEKFSVHASLLQSASWGQPAGDATVGNRGTSNATSGIANTNERNFMSVNEAYATWMMSEDFHAKIGRMNYGFGDGSVMSVNDWQMQPYAFDGLTLNYEQEFGRFTFFTFKYRDYSSSVSSDPNAQTTTTSDPQHDAYGLVFDLKTMPEWLKMVNAHVIQDVGDSVWSSSAGSSSVNTTQNLNTLRAGVGAGFGMMGVDLKADYEMVKGKAADKAAGTGTVFEDSASTAKHDIAQNMYQLEVGYSMPALMGSRWYVGYHHDSGTSNSDTATKFNTYDGYFHDLHSGSGMMEIVGWGNLTMTDIGWTVKPTDSTDVGLQYSMFTKTNSEDVVNGGTYGKGLFMGGTKSGSSKIGNEVDLWAEHKYDGGLSMLARLGMFMPGDTLKDDSIKKGDSITQFMVQGKLVF
ncbi:MAG: alginate export family protein [Bdellovibrionales bacterium]